MKEAEAAAELQAAKEKEEQEEAAGLAVKEPETQLVTFTENVKYRKQFYSAGQEIEVPVADLPLLKGLI